MKAAPVPPPQARVASNQVGGSSNLSFDDDDAFGEPTASLDLDLDLSKGPPMPMAAPGAPRGGAASSGAIDRSSLGKVAATSSSPPSSGAAQSAQSGARPSKDGGQARDAGRVDGLAIATPEIDPFEARALADYGPAPAHWWMTPLYAYRVKKRQPELKRSLLVKRDEATRAETSAEDALMGFAERVRGAAQGNPKYAEVLQEVVQTEDLFRARDTALAGETDAHKQRQAQLEAGIAELEAQLSAVQAEEKVVIGELTEAEALLKRADARVKRAEIEIRNATTQLEPKPVAQK